MERSPGYDVSPLELAIKKEKTELIEPLAQDVLGTKENPRLKKGPPGTLMQATGTGQ
jgi:hypothetical protein